MRVLASLLYGGVADENCVQDDLAEHAVPSPGPYSPLIEATYDPYYYFDDIEYLSDSYFDDSRAGASTSKREKKSTPAHASRKRARDEEHDVASHPAKRLRGENGPASGQKQRADLAEPMVKWLPQQDRVRASLAAAPAVDPKTLPTVSLLKDWRTRLQGVSGVTLAASTKAEAAATEQERATDQEQAGSSANGAAHELAADNDDAEAADDYGQEDDNPNGTAIEPTDLTAVARLLGEDSMNQLREALKAKGLDPDAIDVVMQDLLEGREPEFDDAEEDDDDGAEEGETAEEEAQTEHGNDAEVTTDQQSDPARRGRGRPRKTPTAPPAAPAEEKPARVSKRKQRDSDDEDEDKANLEQAEEAKGHNDAQKPKRGRGRPSGSQAKRTKQDDAKSTGAASASTPAKTTRSGRRHA